MKVIENRKIFFGISLAIIILGIIMTGVNGLQKGIDFEGGTLIQINIGKQISVDEVREITDDFDKEAHIIHSGDEKEEIIIKSKMDLNNDEINNIFEKFKEKYNLKDEDLVQSQKFGPTMGSEIRKKALLSAGIAVVAMLVYITLRFEFKFALSAIIALIHDVLITLSVYAIFKVPINSSFIAAILTILGYSINDTIVIFDRIRENAKSSRKVSHDGEYYSSLINDSIRQSIARTINTSLTTLVTIVLLYVLGVEDIKVLAFPLIIGVISGTYSSLFIASPIWYLLKSSGKDANYKPRKA
ncbi:protein translocase subunit SecF [Anaerosalibacter sp. Marseille-P3206]|uniref:protein translocase subunit SecF n=1 Tax=Anaerosalibacter sp. Marseille-P3206 TaxID=1871005 RepID=UPI000986B104|nr:protein translocase subunit SecF [Anaerosalibacter sp. Marseille-P3206]